VQQLKNKKRSMPEKKHHSVSNALSDIQLLLAEKRTPLALMRTGIAVLSLLIATSKYYKAVDVFSFLIGYTAFFFSAIRGIFYQSLSSSFPS